MLYMSQIQEISVVIPRQCPFLLRSGFHLFDEGVESLLLAFEDGGVCAENERACVVKLFWHFPGIPKGIDPLAELICGRLRGRRENRLPCPVEISLEFMAPTRDVQEWQ